MTTPADDPYDKLRRLEHLGTDEVRKALDTRMGARGPEQPHQDGSPPPDPRDKKVWEFDFAWASPRGELFAGHFRSIIRGQRQRSASDNFRNQLCAGMPWDSIAPRRRLLNGALGFLEFALDPRARPDWAKDLTTIEWDDLILALYEEVFSHEKVYFRLGENQSAGAAPGRDPTVPARPVVEPQTQPPGE